MKYIKYATVLLFMSVICGGCNETAPYVPPEKTDGPGGQQIDQESVCGDGTWDADSEVCDESADDSISASCSDFDNTKTWKNGGKPGCQACRLTQGTCEEESHEQDKDSVCGNHIKEKDEACDGKDGLPASCKDVPGVDQNIKWSGGAPICSNDCKKITLGTCYYCGDGKVSGDEECDGKVDKNLKCESIDSSIQWTETSHVSCSDKCRIDYSTCVPVEHEFVFMNWNVLHGGWDCYDEACMDGPCPIEQCKNKSDHNKGDGRDVLPRAEKVHQIISQYEVKPDVIAIVEVSGDWHSEEVTQLFGDLGYVWANNNRNPENYGYYQSNILYQKDKFDLLEQGNINYVYADTDPLGRGNKTIGIGNLSALYTVLQNKEDGEVFITFGTHWDAHNIGSIIDNPDGTKPNVFQNALGWTVSHELNRTKGALDAAEKVLEMRAKYPNAHVLYGGDFNTMDFDTIFNSAIPEVMEQLGPEERTDLLGLLIGKLFHIQNFDATGIIPDSFAINDMPALIVSIRDTLAGTSYPVFPDGFIGSYQEFRNHSKLTDARAYAVENIDGTEDLWSTNNDSLVEYEMIITEFGRLSLVIDYAFFSQDNLNLKKYKIMTQGDGVSSRDDYVFISDHFPVMTTYSYALHK